MTKTSETIVFFGSGPVAAKSLDLLANDFNIEAVITKPAKSRAKDPVPVLDLANKLDLKTFLPRNRTELDDFMKNSPVKSKIAILIDYGIIVSQQVIDYFSLGIVNSHFSLLPQWRGADPITFSILSGEPKTGVSLMLLTAGMDEGPLLKQDSLKISNSTNSIDLTDSLIDLSHAMLVDVIPEYIDGVIKPYPQPNDEKVTYSRKLTKSDGSINWNKSAEQIEREIRAYIEWPKSYTKAGEINIIITKAHVIDRIGTPGNFEIEGSNLIFYCKGNSLSIDRIKPAGKNEMDIKSFLAGYRSILTS